MIGGTFIASELDILVSWIHERDRIRAAKAAGAPRPWTTDPLLRDYRWCNVRRMDDAVSVEMLSDWYRYEMDPPTALVAAVLGRLVNWPDSLMAITAGGTFELPHLPVARKVLAARAAAGAKVFTGAYVVPGVPGKAKPDSVCDLAYQVAEAARCLYQPSMRGTWAELIALDGLGSFLAGQVVADVAHLAAGWAWPDRTSWAPVGPGSARGMNRLLGRPKDQPMRQGEFEAALPALALELRPRVLSVWEDRHLHAMDVQNCLCEFDKYRRLTLKEGTVRARYDGAGSTQEALL
jgi:hypothetical protein